MTRVVQEKDVEAAIEMYVRKLKPETEMEARGIRFTLITLGLATSYDLNRAAGDIVARKYHGEHV